ncbi:MAG: hypothetical protein U0586_11700 [Candidatus Brocadiaceae bacterium]
MRAMARKLQNGLKSVSTQLRGDIDVPDLSGWPNQGVGRINPDGSSGACTSCHPRHSFSIEIARKTIHLFPMSSGTGRPGV